MGRSGGFSDGRDIGVVCNLPNPGGPTVLPMSGDVGSQYTPSAGWAQAITYHRDVLGDGAWRDAMTVVLGGEASVATNGFWSALTMATTLQLPLLFYIEDNGYGISVPSQFQTPGANIAENLASFKNLLIKDGDGTDPDEASRLIAKTMSHVRSGKGPALLRLRVPRLSGHSGQDTQAYKPPGLLAEEAANDPLPKLKAYLLDGLLTRAEWEEVERHAAADVDAALGAARRDGHQRKRNEQEGEHRTQSAEQLLDDNLPGCQSCQHQQAQTVFLLLTADYAADHRRQQ
jgi:2-oxoisovalerate dehydrogenase E1 component